MRAAIAVIRTVLSLKKLRLCLRSLLRRSELSDHAIKFAMAICVRMLASTALAVGQGPS